ncbi:hypothetical protein BSF41_21580 [Flavobacterium sp. ACN2]|jgi:hypothetical protein|nr:hypothetical protein BSF41_21580 [Flavobacterium sp. ACN2]
MFKGFLFKNNSSLNEEFKEESNKIKNYYPDNVDNKKPDLRLNIITFQSEKIFQHNNPILFSKGITLLVINFKY